MTKFVIISKEEYEAVQMLEKVQLPVEEWLEIMAKKAIFKKYLNKMVWVIQLDMAVWAYKWIESKAWDMIAWIQSAINWLDDFESSLVKHKAEQMRKEAMS